MQINAVATDQKNLNVQSVSTIIWNYLLLIRLQFFCIERKRRDAVCIRREFRLPVLCAGRQAKRVSSFAIASEQPTSQRPKVSAQHFNLDVWRCGVCMCCVCLKALRATYIAIYVTACVRTERERKRMNDIYLSETNSEPLPEHHQNITFVVCQVQIHITGIYIQHTCITSCIKLLALRCTISQGCQLARFTIYILLLKL